MTGTVAVGPGQRVGRVRAVSSDLSDRAIWSFVAVGIASRWFVALPTDNARSFLFDVLSVVAAVGAVVGMCATSPAAAGCGSASPSAS